MELGGGGQRTNVKTGARASLAPSPSECCAAPPTCSKLTFVRAWTVGRLAIKPGWRLRNASELGSGRSEAVAPENVGLGPAGVNAMCPVKSTVGPLNHGKRSTVLRGDPVLERYAARLHVWVSVLGGSVLCECPRTSGGAKTQALQHLLPPTVAHNAGVWEGGCRPPRGGAKNPVRRDEPPTNESFRITVACPHDGRRTLHALLSPPSMQQNERPRARQSSREAG